MRDVVASRLRAQRLTGPPFEDAAAAVRWFGAVQAQDFAGAKWALGIRVRSATEAAIDRLYDAGEILRTHVLRPTWHFVAPEDIRWMLALTGPKIRQAMAFRHRELGLDARTITRAHRVFTRALEGGRHLTRLELGEALSAAGISPEGQRLPHLLVSAELEGILVGGPRKGRQLSFALLDERVPAARTRHRDEAIAELTRRYFAGHGPAQVRDFAWWSGLTQAETRRGIAMAGDALAHAEIAGAHYWFDATREPIRPGPPRAHLLPNFDEYTVGYADRSALLNPARPFEPRLFAFGSVLANVVVVGGRVAGSWRRVASRARLEVEIRTLGRVTAAERSLVEAAATRLSRFAGRSVALAWPGADARGHPGRPGSAGRSPSAAAPRRT